MSRMDEIRARLVGVTPGPWFRTGGPGLYFVESAEADDVITGIGRSQYHEISSDRADYDSTLIANAPDDLAYLLAEHAQIITWLRSQATKAQTKDSAYLVTVEMMYREIADAIERGDHREAK
jgi:hypothetical protein